MLLADAALALSARSLAQARARVLGELISGTASVAMRGCFPIRQTFPVNTIWSARQGDPDQHFSPLRLPSASPPKRRWRFASPNANSMPQASSASAQRGEDEKEQVRQRRDKPTSPPGRCECTVFRRDHKEFQQLRGTCFMRCGISASLQKSCASGPRWLPATKTNRRLVLVFDPQQARDHSLLSARSASTFGHHSTFAQLAASCRLPIYQQPPRWQPSFRNTNSALASKRSPRPAPCELCDKSSTTEWRHPFLACLVSLLPRGGRL